MISSENEPSAINPSSVAPPKDISEEVHCDCGHSNLAYACKNAVIWMGESFKEFDFKKN
jgi:hypothetical protein